MMTDTKRYADALRMATEAHEGQVRKFNPVPYITHPVAVAAIVRTLGGDENLQIAALLHDVVEDTDLTLNDVYDAFGSDVEVLVDAVTRRDGETYLDFVRRTRDAGPRARLLKRADIVHNSSTIPADHGLNRRYARALAMLDEADER